MCLGINWISEIMVQFCYLLHFSQRCELLSSKAAFTIDLFAAVNYNYNPKQWALNHRNTQSGWKSTNYKPWAFEPVKFCFLRGRLRWLTAAKNANVSWFLNFRICMFLKSAAIIITIPSNEPWTTETHKADGNQPITNYDLLNPSSSVS